MLETSIASVNKSHTVSFSRDGTGSSVEYQINWLEVRGQKGTDL